MWGDRVTARNGQHTCLHFVISTGLELSLGEEQPCIRTRLAVLPGFYKGGRKISSMAACLKLSELFFFFFSSIGHLHRSSPAQHSVHGGEALLWYREWSSWRAEGSWGRACAWPSGEKWELSETLGILGGNLEVVTETSWLCCVSCKWLEFLGLREEGANRSPSTTERCLDIIPGK